MADAANNLLVEIQVPVCVPCSPRCLEIDGLRGVAIILVISKHYGFGHYPGSPESFGVRLFNSLYPALSGVDLFFVLSGYLIGSHLLAALDTPHYYGGFYVRRVCRTFPLYYLVLLLFSTAVMAREALAPVIALDVKWPFGTPWSMVAYALFIQNFWVVANGLGPSWLLVTWSLAVQEQFYLVLPCVLRRLPRPMLGYGLVGLCLMGPLCRLALACILPAWELNTYDCLLCCRTDTLGIGVLVAWLLQREGARKRIMQGRAFLAPTAAMLLAGFSLLTYLGFGLGSAVLFVSGHTLLAVLYLVVVLIARFAADGVVGAVLRTGLLRELGRISYGLFLLHLIVRDLFFRGVVGMPPTLNGWDNWLPTVAAFLLTVFLAEISWLFLEKPLIAWSKSAWLGGSDDR